MDYTWFFQDDNRFRSATPINAYMIHMHCYTQYKVLVLIGVVNLAKCLSNKKRTLLVTVNPITVLVKSIIGHTEC